jgi:hypothetical protein
MDLRPHLLTSGRHRLLVALGQEMAALTVAPVEGGHARTEGMPMAVRMNGGRAGMTLAMQERLDAATVSRTTAEIGPTESEPLLGKLRRIEKTKTGGGIDTAKETVRKIENATVTENVIENVTATGIDTAATKKIGNEMEEKIVTVLLQVVSPQ